MFNTVVRSCLGCLLPTRVPGSKAQLGCPCLLPAAVHHGKQWDGLSSWFPSSTRQTHMGSPAPASDLTQPHLLLAFGEISLCLFLYLSGKTKLQPDQSLLSFPFHSVKREAPRPHQVGCTAPKISSLPLVTTVPLHLVCPLAGRSELTQGLYIYLLQSL